MISLLTNFTFKSDKYYKLNELLFQEKKNVISDIVKEKIKTEVHQTKIKAQPPLGQHPQEGIRPEVVNFKVFKAIEGTTQSYEESEPLEYEDNSDLLTQEEESGMRDELPQQVVITPTHATPVQQPRYHRVVPMHPTYPIPHRHQYVPALEVRGHNQNHHAVHRQAT